MVLVLDQPESEAIPLQWSRCGDDQFAPFRLSQFPVLDGSDLNVAGILNLMPNDILRAIVLKPAAVGFVPANVRVDDVRHSPDIAPAGDFPRTHYQPRIVKPALFEFHKTAQMSGLHRTRR